MKGEVQLCLVINVEEAEGGHSSEIMRQHCHLFTTTTMKGTFLLLFYYLINSNKINL